MLDAEVDIANAEEPVVIADRLKGQVSFTDVHFHYPGMAAGTLYDISLDVEPGGTVALLGPTGSGKSSILNLVSRFYDVTEGAVHIDGRDVRDYELDSLRHNVGVVLQDVNLAAGTIYDNICYGEPDASQEKVEFAAKLAQAHEFITQMPDGYETVLGEGGSGLSGGQRQRIAIARALLVRPSILIFDDSMSAVDAETEQKLREALAPILAKVTAFIIAQRISTVRDADLILVIQEGRIAARGTHEELIESSPLYADIVHSQLSEG